VGLRPRPRLRLPVLLRPDVLLQTPEYARELIKAVGETPEADIDSEVERRMARQRIFDKDDPPVIWALIMENVINWPIGGSDMMRTQLRHLLDMSARPNVGVRVVELAAGAHAGVDGSFLTISGDFGDVAYTESPGAGRLVQATSELRSYSLRYDRISQAASSEKRSQELIQRAMEAL
jgi:hypothetical protein